MSYTIELNNAKRDDTLFTNKFKPTSKVVEIYSALVDGKDTSKYGKETDKTVDYVKSLGAGIANGDGKAMAELNTLRKYSIEPVLMKEFKLFDVFGTYKALGFDESIEVESEEYIGEKSRVQALNADVVFPAYKKEKYAVGTKTISGGWATDYRKLLLGDMSVENEGKAQTRLDIMNKAKRLVLETAFAATKKADINYGFEGAGLTKAGVDNVLKNVRRLGRDTSVIGTYGILSQFTPWAGYNPELTYDTTRWGISEKDLIDLRNMGLLGGYNGAALVEIENPYDFTARTTDGKNFGDMLPDGLALVLARGVKSPINMWTRGGLTTFTGNDVSTGHVLSRFDMEFAVDVTKGREYLIGTLHDTNLDDLK